MLTALAVIGGVGYLVGGLLSAFGFASFVGSLGTHPVTVTLLSILVGATWPVAIPLCLLLFVLAFRG